ncbi:histamine H1 receptor [Sardina pilchardus]|uniref:histamine H1 receptor n=1 Tax=Sardina pilchardus TaxID=27697 RepID=UPI002E1158E8
MEPVPVPFTADCKHNGTWPELSESDCPQTNTSVSLPHQLHSGFLGVLLGSVAVLTVFMNILVLYAVRKERMLHTVGNLYIVSLSVADLIVGATVMPLNLAYLLEDEWKLGRAVCQFWLVMDYVASTASIFNLFILCLDRYRSVQHPLSYLKYRTRGRATLMISGAWLLSLTWVIPILGWRSFAYVDRKPETENKCDTDFRFVTWFKVLTATLNFYVPSVLMLWFYSRIFVAVREHYRQWESIFSSMDSSANKGDGHKGVNKVSHRGSLPTLVHTEVLLDQYSLEQQFEPRDMNEGGVEKHQTVRKSLHKNGSFFHVSGKSKKKSVRHTQNSFCSSEDEDLGSESPSRGSVLPMICLQSSEDHEDSKMIVSVNNCDVMVENSETGVCELTSKVHQLAHTVSCNNLSQPFRGSLSEDSSQKPDTSKAVALKHTWQKFRDQSRQCVQNMRIHKERKAAKQLGFIITGFMVCWIPYFITFMVMAFCTTCVHHDLHMFTIWLGYINSTLNPFIYPMCNENFKRVFKRIFHIGT